jgi:2OG-Fe(II) oxygenase superfamily
MEVQSESLSVVNPDLLATDLSELAKVYQSATPFPHLVIDDFLRPEVVQNAIDEFPEPETEDWIGLLHTNERKHINQTPGSWGQILEEIGNQLTSGPFVDFLSRVTGIDSLIADDRFQGGGLAVSKKGGYLNIHADFTVHPYERSWKRRINLLLYLNRDWDPNFGGDLELWSRDMSCCEKSIAPIANRVVIFSTDFDSYHGHPNPLACPEDRSRRSLAIYYFTQELEPVARSTEYKARPGDGLKRIPIYLDKQALRSYDFLRRKLKFSDQFANRIMKSLNRKKRK